MQRILSSPNPLELSELKQRLEGAGIACLTRNETLGSFIGVVPLTEGVPELWIEDDAKMADALRVKQNWKAEGSVAGSPWVCPVCGQTSEAQFTSCWKCGASKPGA
jgi:hypothetical protein